MLNKYVMWTLKYFCEPAKGNSEFQVLEVY